MCNASLLVHKINNNIENIEVLLEEENLDKEIINLVGKIIDEQLNNIIENSELYYLEDEKFAINKEKLFFLEFVNYVRNQLAENLSENEVVIKTIYKNKLVCFEIKTLKKILKYLLYSSIDNIEDIEVNLIGDELHIKINLEKNKEHSLQSK